MNDDDGILQVPGDEPLRIEGVYRGGIVSFDGEPSVGRRQCREVAAQLFKVDETAISLSKGEGTCWLRVAIPHRPEQLTFRGKTWFAALEAAMKFLVACVVNDPNGAAQAAAAAQLNSDS